MSVTCFFIRNLVTITDETVCASNFLTDIVFSGVRVPAVRLLKSHHRPGFCNYKPVADSPSAIK